MKIFMILLCLGLFSVSVFLIAKYGIKKKESQEYVNGVLDSYEK